MRKSTQYTQKVMDDLDALLADLQSTTAHISYNNQGPPPPHPASQASPAPSNTRPTYQTGAHTNSGSGGLGNEEPPPLPPPPQDLPETIPPPQQFGDQQALYEPQQLKRDSNTRVSGTSSHTSHSSQGSSGGENNTYYGRDIPAVSAQLPTGPTITPPPLLNNINSGAPQLSSSSGNFPPPPPPSSNAAPPPAGNSVGPPGMSMISNNLSELDQLLSDLNSAQFMAEVDQKHAQTNKQPPPPVAPKPSRGGGGGQQAPLSVNTNANSTANTSVDSLLDQLESSVPSTPNPPPNFPVQNQQVSYQSNQEQTSQVSQPQQGVQSAATQELDDLMATLSDFKMKDTQGPSVQAQVAPMRRSPSPTNEPSYAKPQKSRNLSQSSSANSSLQSSSITPGNVSSTSTQGGQLESMLGDLQTDLSRQGVNTKTKGLCAACNQPVVGQVITALGKIWHIEHFNCAKCHETLGTKNFYERDGMAYCEQDYHSLFAPRCSYCNGPIVDKCVTALNSTWHPEHFFCAQCGRPFGDDGFHEKDGKAYCRADFFEMFAPRCGGCGQAIVNNYISGLNRHWHPDCFACWDCHKPFDGGSFFDYEGLPYCETHYHQKRGSLCAGCQKPIAGRCITAMYKKFHPEHFVCAFCLKQLNKGTFKEQNDRPYCHPCFVKLFG